MTPPILARVAQLHGSSEDVDCDTISTATSWEYVSKSSSLSDLTRFETAFSASSASNNHHVHHRPEISHSSVFSTSSSHIQSNQNNGRGILPHGIVPLPAPHRSANYHNSNGFQGYRLTQKDLLQPQPSSLSSVNNGVTPFTRDSTAFSPKDDSNPVLRSTSFNLDCGAARKYTYKFRQNSENTALPTAQAPVRKGPLNQNKPQQKAIVFVAENPENGACDVYNVPFQSDIYSLPVDSIASAVPVSSGVNKKVGRSNSVCTSKIIHNQTSVSSFSAAPKLVPPPPISLSSTNATKASSSISHHHNFNQSQRVKPLESVSPAPSTSVSSSVSNNCSNANGGVTPPPPQRKNNLNRLKSRDDSSASKNMLESCNIKCSPPQLHENEEVDTAAGSCKPPQRWSSLAVQSSSSPPRKDGFPSCSEPLSSSASVAKQHLTSSVTTAVTQKNLPPPPPHHHSNVSSSANTPLAESNKLGNMDKSINHFTSNSKNNAVGNKPINMTPTPKQQETISSKKPRSRSVDPGGDKSIDQQHYNQSIKYYDGASVSTSNANQRMSTNNLNYIDNPNNHPLPPEPIENKETNSTHVTTADRKNPLGLSFLNLFRRHKTSGVSTAGGSSYGGRQLNTHHQGAKSLEEANHHHHQSESEFMSLVPTSSANNENSMGAVSANATVNINNNKEDTSYYFRELPPPPPGELSDDSGSDGIDSPPGTSPMECRDFAASIERVKDCGWYWGPLSSEAAEDLLKNEPDGSFIVRDSSDARYIFSLTFKLHGLVRHVRIEHDQGNFSFGPLTRFKAATIVDFVEKAVAHSRSGRYLFFLHRRPVLGPMQVQLLHPYSRFMHPRSLKHMCRFVILKYVRRDLIHTLPLPKPLQDYLNTPHYYFEPPDRVSSGGSNHCAVTNGSRGITSSSSNISVRNTSGHNHPSANSRVV